MNADSVAAEGERLGRKADNSEVLGYAVRVGLVCYGLVHLLIAWLAIQLAVGTNSGSASTEGAMSELAQKPFGQITLYVVAAGFLALVVWKAIDAAVGYRDEEGFKRLAKRGVSAGKVLLFGALGYSAVKIATGAGSSGGGTDGPTARVMSLPGGQVLVGLAGAGVIAVAGALIWRGLSEGFTEHLEAKGRMGDAGKAYVIFGKIGYVSKGVALAAIGGLFVWAAWTHDPEKSGGLDQALTTVLQQPFGVPMLLVIAVGIGCYGLFCFACARHLDR